MKNYTVKDLVLGKTARFVYYRDNELWYGVVGTDFIFPIPTDNREIGNATFNYEEKSSLLMRYIRKYLEKLQKED